MKYILHMIGLKKWTIYELKHGVAVELFVDFYYLPLSDQYHRIHYMHEILITGYEEDGRVYYWGYTGNIYKENIINLRRIYKMNENINLNTITLNENNLELLCRVCHALEHEGQLSTDKSLMFDDDGNLVERSIDNVINNLYK